MSALKAENLAGEVISHRQRRRWLFAKGWENKDMTSPTEKKYMTSPADLISHQHYTRIMSEKGRETDNDDEEEPDDDDERRGMSEKGRETDSDNEEEEETDDDDDDDEEETDEEEEEDEFEMPGTGRIEEPKKTYPGTVLVDESSWITVDQYRRHWNYLWSSIYGAFEDTTRIPPMLFTDKPVRSFPMDTLQLFSVKLAATRGEFQLPVDVFGMVALRDPIDHNRNIVFQRTRDNCQTLTIEDPYLVLTGPTRAVMFIVSCPVIIEVDLKVKGANDSMDESLVFRVAAVVCSKSLYSHLLRYAFPSKLGTLEFTLGHIVSSVEATIFVRVTHGSWRDGLHGVFAAFTTGIVDRRTGTGFLAKRIVGPGHERILLLDSRGEKLPITVDGKINLSRRVVTVEDSGKVIVCVRVLEGDKEVVEKACSFNSFKAGSSIHELEFSFCKMEVTVFWSLISDGMSS